MAVLALLAPTPAAAAFIPEAEPNDDPMQAQPLRGGSGATGTIDTATDTDWYVLRIRPQRQVRFRLAVIETAGCALPGRDLHSQIQVIAFAAPTFPGGRDFTSENATLLGDVASGGTIVDGPGASLTGAHESVLTTPGIAGGAPRDFFFRVASSFGAAGCTYQFEFTRTDGAPSDAVDPAGPPNLQAVQTREPNDISKQAFGPLLGRVNYDGAFETGNDVDVLRAPIVPGARIHVSLVTISPAHVYTDQFPFVTVFGPKGEAISNVVPGYSINGQWTSNDPNPASGSASVFSFIAPRWAGQARFVIRNGLAGSRWRLQLNPLAAIVEKVSFSTTRARRGRLIAIRTSGIAPGTKLTIRWKRGGKTVLRQSRRISGTSFTVRAPKRKGTYVVVVAIGARMLAERTVRVT